MGGVKTDRRYGQCFLCLYVKELQRDGTLQSHKIFRGRPRADWCPGGARLPRGNGESYRSDITTKGHRTMDFGEALKALKDGKRVARWGWADTHHGWLVLVPGSAITVEAERPLGKAAPDLVGLAVVYLPHIDMYDTKRQLGPWTPTQADILAGDWDCWDAT